MQGTFREPWNPDKLLLHSKSGLRPHRLQERGLRQSRTPRPSHVSLGFASDDQWAIDVVLGCHTMVLHAARRIGAQEVEPNAVDGRVNEIKESFPTLDPSRWFDLQLEHRVLHTLAVVYADLRRVSQPAATCGVRCLDVIGYENVHQGFPKLRGLSISNRSRLSFSRKMAGRRPGPLAASATRAVPGGEVATPRLSFHPGKGGSTCPACVAARPRAPSSGLCRSSPRRLRREPENHRARSDGG